MATRNASRAGRTSNTIIDHILTDIFTYKYSLSVNDTPISDHQMLLLSMDVNSNFSTTGGGATFRKGINETQFRQLLIQNFCNDEYTCDDPNEFFYQLNNYVMQCTTLIKNKNVPLKPWVNTGPKK